MSPRQTEARPQAISNGYCGWDYLLQSSWSCLKRTLASLKYLISPLGRKGYQSMPTCGKTELLHARRTPLPGENRDSPIQSWETREVWTGSGLTWQMRFSELQRPKIQY